MKELAYLYTVMWGFAAGVMLDNAFEHTQMRNVFLIFTATVVLWRTGQVFINKHFKSKTLIKKPHIPVLN